MRNQKAKARAELFKRFKKSERLQYKTLFAHFDADRSDSINLGELTGAFAALGVPVTDAEARAMLAEADQDGSGEIEFDEFLWMIDQARRNGKYTSLMKANQMMAARAAQRKQAVEDAARKRSMAVEAAGQAKRAIAAYHRQLLKALTPRELEMLNDLFYDAVDAALAAAGAGEADVGEEDERLDTAQVQARPSLS